jgi:hypothetical protein
MSATIPPLTPAELRAERAGVARDVSAMLHAVRIASLRRMLDEARQRVNGGPTVERLEAALQEAER